MRYIRLFYILCISCVVLTPYAQAENAIERIEPPFWWVGFENTQLQLLVHGKNISEYDPIVTYAGVSLKKVTRVTSPNYLFIDLTIAADSPVGKFDILFKNKSGQTITHRYELKARKAGSAARKGLDSSDAIYLIVPDRFANGSPDNDNVAGMKDKYNRADKNGRHGGDIKGIIDHLDYISNMGFTAIWGTPTLENNQTRTSYHGYSITDHYKQDARFGSNEDFKALSKQARAHGMGLIMDLVNNHIGSEHWWMRDIPSHDWINFYDKGYTQSSHIHNTVYDPYAAQKDKDNFSDGWFDRTMPDLNQRNPLLATYLIQNAIWWIEYADLSGIRMDTYSYPDMTFSAEWSRRIMTEYPNFFLVGEEYEDSREMISYWQRGKINKNGYVSSLPSLIDFPLNIALLKGLREEDGKNTGLGRLYGTLSMDNQYADPDNLMILSDNHDMTRLYTQLGEDFDLYKMAIAYTLTMRGIPEIFYGTELLKTNPKGKDDGIIRSDFPGGWAGDNINGFTGKGLSAPQAEAQTFVRKLLNWRKNKPVIHHGKLLHYVPEGGVYVYFRYDDHNKIMVIINKNMAGRELSLDRFSEMLSGMKKAKDVISDAEFDLTKSLSLAPRSVMILDVK